MADTFQFRFAFNILTNMFRLNILNYNFSGYYRVLTMVYNTQRYWVFGLCPSSGFKLLKSQRFGNWICFRPQVREGTYSVGSLRKSYPHSLDLFIPYPFKLFRNTLHIWNIYRAQRLFLFLRTTTALGINDRVNETPGITVQLTIVSLCINRVICLFYFPLDLLIYTI
jgi:hypothetical protein